MIEINNRTKSRIDLKMVKEVTEEFLKHYKIKNKEVSIAFVGDAEIRKLNKKYRRLDKPTDILAFPGEDRGLFEKGGIKGGFLGELIIDYAQIKRQAKLYSDSIRDELIFILVHGLLHLLGHEDETERGKQEMEALGRIFVNKLKGKNQKSKMQFKSQK